MRPLGSTSTRSEIEDTVNTSSQTPSADFGQLGSIADQAGSFEALDLLVSMFPTLPPAYFTIHATSHSGVGAQCNSTADFEAWRTALQIPTNMVDLHSDSVNGWLSAETTVRGVHLRITGFGLAITEEQAKPPARPVAVVTLPEAVALMGALPMPAADEPQTEVINLNSVIGDLSAAFRKTTGGAA
jgi:hypothetical protein